MFGQPQYNAQYSMDSSGRIMDDGRNRSRDQMQRMVDANVEQNRRIGEDLIVQNRRLGQDANALNNASSARAIAEENARQLATMYGSAANNLNQSAQQTQANLASLAGGMMQAALR